MLEAAHADLVSIISLKRSHLTSQPVELASPNTSRCARLVVADNQRKRGGIHGEGYDHRDRLGKASLPRFMRRRRTAGRCCARRCRGHSCSASWLSSRRPSWRWKRARRRTTGAGRSAELGHEVRLIPPIYVKPFVRRQKNDAADAEAIAEAASRPTMRFVAVKTEDQQARAMIFRTRDLLVRQRTQLVNALRGHLAEHGIVAAQGLAQVKVAGGRAMRWRPDAACAGPGVGPAIPRSYSPP